MILKEQWEENLILNYVEGDSDENDNVVSLMFYFSFYDCNYSFSIWKKDIEAKNIELSGLEGDSKLFNSFETLLEDDYLEKLQQTFEKYEVYHKELAQEMETYTEPDPEKFKRVSWLEKFLDQDTGESFFVTRSRIEDVDYELKENELVKPKD